MTLHAPHRKRLPQITASMTNRRKVGGHKLYAVVGFFDEESLEVAPGEVFLRVAKEGSDIAGLMDALAIAISVGLQHGVPWEVFYDKMRYTKFGGIQDGENTSLVDGLAQAVQACIDERKSIVGAEEPAPNLQAMPKTLLRCLYCDGPPHLQGTRCPMAPKDTLEQNE